MLAVPYEKSLEYLLNYGEDIHHPVAGKARYAP